MVIQSLWSFSTSRALRRGTVLLAAILACGALRALAEEQPRPKVLLPLGESVPEDIADPGIWQQWINEEARKRGVTLTGDWARVATFFRDQAADLRVNWPGALVQSIHETRFFTFIGGDVRPASKNVGGIGVTKDEVLKAKREGRPPGDTYESVEVGVRAFLQYIATYAGARIPEGELASDYLKARDAHGQSNQERILEKVLGSANSPGFLQKFGREVTYFDLGSMPNPQQPDGYPDFRRGALGYAGDPNYGPKLAKHWDNATTEVRNRYYQRMYDSLATARPPASPIVPTEKPSPPKERGVDYDALSAARPRPAPASLPPKIAADSRPIPTKPTVEPKSQPEEPAPPAESERKLDGRYLVYVKPTDSSSVQPSPWLLTWTTSDRGSIRIDLEANPRASRQLLAVCQQAGLLNVSGLDVRPVRKGLYELDADQLAEVLRNAVKMLEESGSAIADAFVTGLAAGSNVGTGSQVHLQIGAIKGTVRESMLGNLTIQIDFQITTVITNERGETSRAPPQEVHTKLLASPVRE